MIDHLITDNSITNDFLEAMGRYVPPEARIMACQFRGDPHEDIPGKWRARVIDNPRVIDQDANVYFAVSAMQRNARGEYRRRKENFAGGLLLMIDDLGDGIGSKHPLSTLNDLEPTALIETSPANFQAVYMFDRLIEDMSLFQRLIQAFIEQQFIGNDPGMNGVNRVFRPPAGVNGKAKYKVAGEPWRVVLSAWNPERRYSPEELIKQFKLVLRAPGSTIPRGATEDKADLIRNFIGVRAALRSAGMMKREEPNLEGWIDVRCPWVHEHTDRADNGAGIREPAEENAWHGAFRCFHASHESKGWRDLTQWLADEQTDVLHQINDNAGDWMDYDRRTTGSARPTE